MNLGVGIALGAAAGTILFAITGEAFWIAIGPSIGIVFALIFDEDDDED